MTPERQTIIDKLNLIGSNEQALLEWLASFELFSAERAKTNLLLLDELLGCRDLLVNVLESAFRAADPDGALNLLERLCGGMDCGQIKAIISDPELCGHLLCVLGGSPFLATILCRNSVYFDFLFVRDQIHQSRSEEQMLEDLRQRIPDGSDFETLQQQLRQYKALEVLRIGSRDLCLLCDLEAVMEELSALAAAGLQRAYEICSQLLVVDYGLPLEQDAEGNTRLAEMTILAMGKFGAWELNFSSDIDLIYCYSTNNGATEGGRRGEQISLHRYFIKLAEMVTKALHQVTGDGFVFRVDTRLRPDGNNGDLVVSLNGAETYYESWGQSWERAAMIKARPVAGSIALGENLLQRLRPFVFRRYLDYGMIEDIKIMKEKINAAIGAEQELNLKLGHGGIREIEFFIQTLQLVNAGRIPVLQQRNSLVLLQLLHEHELISSADRDRLAEAYRFLREVEHRIQIVQERQTHMLPREDRDMLLLARRCGYRSLEEFSAALNGYRSQVSEIFNELFHSEEEEQIVRPDVAFIVDPESDSDLVKDLLEEKGFNNPDAAYESLMTLYQGSPNVRMTRRARRNVERLLPQLMVELLDSPNPDQALNNLEAFLQGIQARTSYLMLLVENPATVKLLIALFGASQLLSRIFIKRPELLDIMVSRNYAVAEKGLEQIRSELAEQLAQADDFEVQLDVLRRFRHEEFLRIALNDLHGAMPGDDCARQLSWLAEACLEQACGMARQELVVRFGSAFSTDAQGNRDETAFAVVGMGKLGGHELNYHSDLDIIFVYEGNGETEPIEGTNAKRFRRLSNKEYFSKLGQRIISILSLATREGIVYQIDTRLRPSGNQGPLVTSLDAFERYHQDSAQPWERQAMTKARVVCGPPDFVERLQQRISELTFERPLPDNLRSEIYRLRGRMETEIAKESKDHVNIKTGRGGMVDVEFITQYLQLRYGREIKSLRTQNTVNLLECMVSHGLIEDEDARQLIHGYTYLRRLENKLRLLHDQSINEFSSFDKGFRKIAKSLGYGGGGRKPEAAFLEEYRQETEGIRRLLEKYLKADGATEGQQD